MDRLLNCWEYMLCGREPGGSSVDEFGVCPSAVDERFDGIHGGDKAGRTCWVVAGSVRKENIQCLFAKDKKNCGMCDFYRIVKREQGDQMRPTIVLVKLLEKRMPEEQGT